ncbi:Dipeptide transport system permease protein DppB [subsurface metagenome]
MRVYLIRRLLLAIPTVCVVSMIIFFLVRMIPGDIIDRMMAVVLSEQGGFGATVDRAMIEHELGLDAPLLVQYGRWVGVVPQVNGNFSGIFQGDLGISWVKRAPVFELVANAWPVTLELGLMGLIISQLIALPIGIYSALRQDTWGDYIGRSFAILCISVPGFWIATLVIVFPSIWWGYMPPIMLIPFTEDPIGNLRMFIVPAIVLGMALSGITMRMTRTMMLEVLRQDYIRTAWAKGLRERVVILRHALKNALIPVVTLIGLQVPLLVGGTVIIEQIFVLPGMGRLILSAILDRDHPLTSGVMLLFAIAVMLTNLMVDLTYGFLDPRIHYK